MGHPTFVFRVETAAGVDPDTDGRRFRRQVRLGGDSEAVGEGRDPGFGELEDLGVVRRSWVRRGVPAESWVGFIEAFELGFDGFS